MISLELRGLRATPPEAGTIEFPTIASTMYHMVYEPSYSTAYESTVQDRHS